MHKNFVDRNGNPLEKGVLYDLSPLSWPLSFQGYECRQQGDFRNLEAVFWDFRGFPHYFNQKEIESIAYKTTSEKVREYLNSAKSLVDWLSINEKRITQSPPKCTTQSHVFYGKNIGAIREAQRD